MGMYGTTDDLLMVGGCKPVEFANASSHNPPLATDEPNFANSDGADYLGAPKLAKRGFAGVRRPKKAHAHGEGDCECGGKSAIKRKGIAKRRP